MRYFDEELVTNSRPHAAWWGELCASREWFHRTEEAMGQVYNSARGIQTNEAAVLPRDAWVEMDNVTRRVMRGDEGAGWMGDLLPFAKPVDIGKLVQLTRVASDVGGTVQRSLSGQVPNPLDKTTYDYRGSVLPIFSTAFGREWREWNTMRSENFDPIIDDQEQFTLKIRRDMALFVLNGDATIRFQGYEAYGIRSHPLAKAINLGTGAGGANINLVTATPEQIEAFVNTTLGAMLDANFIVGGINLYVSPEIARKFDVPYSGAAGFKIGSLRDALLANRRINKIETTFELTGNEFFGFVPDAQYIRPIVGMATNTTAMTRLNPTDNYQFLTMGAMGLEIRADFNNRSGVFYSVVVN